MYKRLKSHELLNIPERVQRLWNWDLIDSESSHGGFALCSRLLDRLLAACETDAEGWLVALPGLKRDFSQIDGNMLKHAWKRV